MGRLDVTIIEAKNLPNKATIGMIDVVATIEVGSQKFTTSVAKNTTEPKYEECFKFTVADPDSEEVHIRFWSKSFPTDEFLGEYKLGINNLTRGQATDQWYILRQCKVCAEVRVSLLAHDFGAEKEQPAPIVVDQQQQQQEAVVGTVVMQQQQPVDAGAAAAMSQQQQQQPPPGFVQPQWMGADENPANRQGAPKNNTLQSLGNSLQSAMKKIPGFN